MFENTSPQQTPTKQASTAAPTNPVLKPSFGTKSACQVAVNTATEDRDKQLSYADVNNRLKTSSTKQATNETASILPDTQVQNSSLLLQQQMLDLMTLPKPQLITFDGDPLNFHVFLNTFDSCVHNSNINDAAKLNRLFELCKDKALRLIKPCALMPSDQGYKRARELLTSRFGDDFEITESYIKKIVSGPPIKGSNVKAMQEFSDDVRGCTETLKAMGKLDEVDTRSRLVKLVERLPYFLQNRWRTEAISTRESTGAYPGIDRFLNFVEKVTKEMSDPVFGIKENTEKPSFKPRNRGSNFNVQATTKNAPAYVKDAPAQSKDAQARPKEWRNDKKPVFKCAMCDEEHPIYRCEEFKKLSPTERIKKVNEKRLCYNCLKYGKHSAKECRNERVCNFHGCQEKHSYLLHDALKKPADAHQENEHVTDNTQERKSADSYAIGPANKQAKTQKIALQVVVSIH